MPGRGRAKPPQRPQGRSAFVFVDPQTGEPELYDFVNVTERNSGLNVHFHRDRLFHAMSTVNVLYESNDRLCWRSRSLRTVSAGGQCGAHCGVFPPDSRRAPAGLLRIH